MAQVTRQETPRGPVYSYAAASFHSPDEMPGLGSPTLRSNFDNLVKREAELHGDYLEDRIPAMRREGMGPTIYRAAGQAIDDARDEASRAIAADLRAKEPAIEIDAAEAVEIRSAVRSMDPGQQARFIQDATLPELIAIVGTGNKVPMQPDMFDLAMQRYMVENHIERAAIAASNPAQPTLDRIIATGSDRAATLAEATEAVDRHKAKVAAADDYERVAQSMIAFIAAIFDQSAEQVLDSVIGRADG
ncbi:hypothetical protein [Altererythrobacter sp. MTPC7]|uniref:hypothetical protein n=1 Tax=Altererythrobacter sp. MTPC7 TaxID=3056567 RepID=UPI0036F1DA01